ncbi:c-type cytochrome [Biformimicrobium ophioploci]|uniref:Cytochrome c5 family protein n=1 Tax=Biformimicrobium ophioploci TaxID=3036711 RepID=A0ABQ6LZ41_9GAMM|nr:c-type cytochrome [Microbulbifer sp. NKW57]GMG87347.1 cytochrome c5 family protein [Microbulbifer sp. NKW57]
MMIRVILIALIAFTAGCGKDMGSTTEFDQATSQVLQPADPALAEIYSRSCRSCHTVAATGAPLTGDVAGWSPRLEKGMDTLVNNVVNGSGGMPPFGMCMDCDLDQFEALIEFMARGKD